MVVTEPKPNNKWDFKLRLIWKCKEGKERGQIQNKMSKQRKAKQESKVLAERGSTSAHLADGEVR